MRIKRALLHAAVCAALIVPVGLRGQNSSINAFSPYTFYGLGDLMTPGTVATRSMGGVGLGMQSTMAVNLLNPAALGTVMRQSFLFNMGLEGQNFYAQQAGRRTSYNTFNIRNVSVQFPLARHLGFGFSVSPYSSVGYRLKMQETNEDILAGVGYVDYAYEGDGGVNEFRAALGWQPLPRLSIGVSAIYYMGDIDRKYGVRITPITGTGTYNQTIATDNESVSHILWNFGVQTRLIDRPDAVLTLGAVYEVGGKLHAKTTRNVASGNIFADTVSYRSGVSTIALPRSVGAGLYFQNPKWAVGADYYYKAWHEGNKQPINTEVAYRNTNTFGVGLQYTPNRGDVRRMLNRWSYRIGYRYTDHYLTFRGHDIRDHALQLGVGIPVSAERRTAINVGLEVGRRGTMSSGLIRETYFKFSVGLSLFGNDLWFVRPKFD